MEEVAEIAKHFPANGELGQLTAIKESFSDDVSFGRLRMVQAWLQKVK
jgi:hypothetical protein